jgi:hypothetical protein
MILDCVVSCYPLFHTMMCGCESHISNYELPLTLLPIYTSKNDTRIDTLTQISH